MLSVTEKLVSGLFDQNIHYSLNNSKIYLHRASPKLQIPLNFGEETSVVSCACKRLFIWNEESYYQHLHSVLN